MSFDRFPMIGFRSVTIQIGLQAGVLTRPSHASFAHHVSVVVWKKLCVPKHQFRPRLVPQEPQGRFWRSGTDSPMLDFIPHTSALIPTDFSTSPNGSSLSSSPIIMTASPPHQCCLSPHLPRIFRSSTCNVYCRARAIRVAAPSSIVPDITSSSAAMDPATGEILHSLCTSYLRQPATVLPSIADKLFVLPDFFNLLPARTASLLLPSVLVESS